MVEWNIIAMKPDDQATEELLINNMKNSLLEKKLKKILILQLICSINGRKIRLK